MVCDSFVKSQLASTQLIAGPYVVYISSRPLYNLGVTKPSYSIEWERLENSGTSSVGLHAYRPCQHVYRVGINAVTITIWFVAVITEWSIESIPDNFWMLVTTLDARDLPGAHSTARRPRVLSYLTESVDKVVLQSQVSHKSVNLFFTFVIVKNKSTDLWASWLLQNNL